MKNTLVFISIVLLIGCGCEKEESIPLQKEGNVIIQKQYIWWNQEEEHDQSIITTNSIFKNYFLAESHQNNKSYLSMQQSNNGNILWKWDEYEKATDLSIRFSYSFGPLLTFQDGPRSYCINMETGKTEWKQIRDNSYYSKVKGNENEYYLIQHYANEGDQYPGFYIVDLLTGLIKQKIIPKFKNKINKNVFNELGSISEVTSFERDHIQYLLISYLEPIDVYNYLPLMDLYNKTEDKWIFTNKNISSVEKTSNPDLSYIVNDYLYHSIGYTITCHNIWTGDSLWSREFKGGFLFGGYIYDNGTLYCAAETDGYYALDAETGDIKWKGERSPGTSSRMVILNGVLYYINGADARLWALDAATGKTLWRLKSPDNFGFKREINVMPGDGIRKGYVLTSTWHGACAYEAER